MMYCKLMSDFSDCGDVEDITARGAVYGSEAECGTPCPGDPIHVCGAGDRLTMYYWNGTMNNWHRPSNIGRYEVCLVVLNVFWF